MPIRTSFRCRHALPAKGGMKARISTTARMQVLDEKESLALLGGAGGVTSVPAMTAPCVWPKVAAPLLNDGGDPKQG